MPSVLPWVVEAPEPSLRPVVGGHGEAVSFIDADGRLRGWIAPVTPDESIWSLHLARASEDRVGPSASRA
jgi:hypothetical protein